MISRKTYCRALNLLQAQENLDAEARQILLTLLHPGGFPKQTIFVSGPKMKVRGGICTNRKRFTISSPENTAERSISAAKIL